MAVPGEQRGRQGQQAQDGLVRISQQARPWVIRAQGTSAQSVGAQRGGSGAVGPDWWVCM